MSAIATATLLPEPPARRHVWTPAEDEALRLAYQTRQRSEDIAQASAGRIAEKYGVSQRAIDFVVRGITWKHASGL